MVTIRITVEDVGDLELASREDYEEFLKSEGVKCVLRNGTRVGYDVLVRDFETRKQGGTYTLGPPIQQQNSGALAHIPVPEEYKKLAAFVDDLMKNKTVNKPMSEASATFAASILAAYRVSYDRDKTVIDDPGSKEDPPTYSWTVLTDSGDEWKKGEHRGTPGARNWLNQHFLDSNGRYGLKNITGASLPKVKGNRKSATGKGDLAIGVATDIAYGDTFHFVRGLVELKTNEYPLKTGQSLLQLLSLSVTSSFKKAVALLATDCNHKWTVFYFADANTIRHQIYRHGRKAWEDFFDMIDSADERDFPDKLWLSTTPEDEQDLYGFEESDRDKEKAKAMQDEAVLERVADYLGGIYGERPIVPSWARAKARIPDYYA